MIRTLARNSILIGNPNHFAIECYHEPLSPPHEERWVFGRMCLWAAGHRFGDIDEPACMLDVTEAHFADTLNQIDALDDPAHRDLTDREAFDFLDRAIYLDDDDRSAEQVSLDSKRFSKFDFLTHGGESFDHTKSFIIVRADQVRLLLNDRKDPFVAAHIDRAVFLDVMQAFLAWLTSDRETRRGTP